MQMPSGEEKTFGYKMASCKVPRVLLVLYLGFPDLAGLLACLTEPFTL